MSGGKDPAWLDTGAVPPEVEEAFKVAAAKLDVILSERAMWERAAREILAVIHGDGGHNCVTKGVTASANEAIDRVCRERECFDRKRHDCDELRLRAEKAESAIADLTTQRDALIEALDASGCNVGEKKPSRPHEGDPLDAIGCVIDDLIEVGNGTTQAELHDDADLLMWARDRIRAAREVE